MSELTIQEVLLADAYEKEIDGIMSDYEKKKQAFIEWLESEIAIMPTATACEYVRGQVDMARWIISKAKEMI